MYYKISHKSPIVSLQSGIHFPPGSARRTRDDDDLPAFASHSSAKTTRQQQGPNWNRRGEKKGGVVRCRTFSPTWRRFRSVRPIVDMVAAVSVSSGLCGCSDRRTFPDVGKAGKRGRGEVVS